MRHAILFNIVIMQQLFRATLKKDDPLIFMKKLREWGRDMWKEAGLQPRPAIYMGGQANG